MKRYHSKSGRFIALIPEQPATGFSVVVTADGVIWFKSSWPCSRMGSGPVRFEFSANGDLVDISRDWDGEDVLALSQDAQEFGEHCINKFGRGIV